MPQLSFAGLCASVLAAGAVVGAATAGLAGRQSTMNLSPRSQARSLASGPLALLDVSSIGTTFR
jgi:hypothetical protein